MEQIGVEQDRGDIPFVLCMFHVPRLYMNGTWNKPPYRPLDGGIWGDATINLVPSNVSRHARPDRQKDE